jgi:hypothetical protein
MPGDRKRFARATKQWHTMLEDQNFSASSDTGIIAVLCSYYSDERADHDGREMPEDTLAIRAVAEQLAQRITEHGRVAELVLNASRDDITAALQDRAVSDMHLVGHGCLSAIDLISVTDDGVEEAYYDWEDIVANVNHLKRGLFVQRTCGVYARPFSVPLGLFATISPANVYVPAGHEIEAYDIDHPIYELLQPLSDGEELTYSYIKSVFYDAEQLAQFSNYQNT